MTHVLLLEEWRKAPIPGAYLSPAARALVDTGPQSR
jgi:hypothetical protein